MTTTPSCFTSLEGAVINDDAAYIEILDVNWQTTAAVGLTVASGGVLGAISLAAFPAQTLAVGGAIGGLTFAGKRRADGKSAFPFMDKQSDETKSTDKPSAKAEKKSVVTTEATAEV